VLRFLLPLLITGLAVSARAETKTVGELLVRSVPSPSRASVEIDSIERVRIECCLTAEVGDGWQPLEADSEGWFVADALRGSYARATVTVPEESTWILEGMGYGGVLVNGDPRIGNLYGYTDDWEPWQPPFDFSFVPVRLRAGANEFLFFGNRYGKLRAKLHRAESALSLNAADVTLPDLVVGEPVDSPGAIVILNATGEPVRNAVLRIELEGVPPRLEDVPLLPPFGLRKVGFSIRGESSPRPGPRALGLRLEQTGMILDETVLELKVKTAGENRRVTFVSQLDGSVQYYGLLPASEPGAQKALVLSLHGAAVEAINQSGSYAPMTWAHVVASISRGPTCALLRTGSTSRGIRWGGTGAGTWPRCTPTASPPSGPARAGSVCGRTGWIPRQTPPPTSWPWSNVPRCRAAPSSWRRISMVWASTSSTVTPTTTCR
jgi:hypothetical protein